MFYKKLIKKATISNYTKDFIAGVDPTGVHTYSRAMKYKNKHYLHRIIGNIGGFAGGYVLGGLVPASTAFAGALLFKKKLPFISRTFKTTSKDVMGIMNPIKIYQSAKAIPYAIKYKIYAQKALGYSKGIEKKFRGLKKQLKGSPHYKFLGKNPTDINIQKLLKVSPYLSKANQRNIKQIKVYSRQFVKYKKKMDVFDRYSRMNLGRGKDIADTGASSLTTLLGVGGAIGSGLLNASSAHMQYGAALKKKKQFGLDKFSGYRTPIPNYKKDAYRKKKALMNSKPISSVSKVEPVKPVK